MQVQVYDPETHEASKTFSKFKDGSFGCRFRRDGLLLSCGTEEGELRLFDLATKTQLRSFKGHAGAVRRSDFVSDLRHVASFGDDQSVCVWNVATQDRVNCFKEHTVRNPFPPAH